MASVKETGAPLTGYDLYVELCRRDPMNLVPETREEWDRSWQKKTDRPNVEQGLKSPLKPSMNRS